MSQCHTLPFGVTEYLDKVRDLSGFEGVGVDWAAGELTTDFPFDFIEHGEYVIWEYECPEERDLRYALYLGIEVGGQPHAIRLAVASPTAFD